MSFLIKNFLRGCLVVVPAVVSLYAVYMIVRGIDGLLGSPVPGLGFAVAVTMISIIGAVASSVIGRRLISLPDRVLAHLPFVKLLYTSLRDLMAALVGERKSFDHPVLVALDPSGGVQVIGFVTRDDLGALGLADHVAVYLPQSISYAGQLLLVRRERVSPLALPASKLVPMIVSGGMAG